MNPFRVALDAAVVAYRVQPSNHNLVCLLEAAEALSNDLRRREREEALAAHLESSLFEKDPTP